MRRDEPALGVALVSEYERRIAGAAPYFGLGPIETEPDSLYRGDGCEAFLDVGFEAGLDRPMQLIGSDSQSGHSWDFHSV